MQQVFYERRQGQIPIQFPDRRKQESGQQTVHGFTGDGVEADQLGLADGQAAKFYDHATVISPGKQNFTSQARQYERETFKIPVCLKIEKKEISGYTHDISLAGLLIFCDISLFPGAPMNLHFSFGDICYLSISGQVVYCLTTENGTSKKYAIGIKFAAIRPFEQKILLSAVQELKQNALIQTKSLLKILISKDTMAKEAANISQDDGSTITKADLIPKLKNMDFTLEGAEKRRKWLSLKTGVNFKHVGIFSEDPQNMRGNIENLIGVSHIPIGIAGPLKVNGEHAMGTYYVPMATTEGAIVFTYTRGMQLISLAGGANVYVLRDEIHISPIFTFESTGRAKWFVKWLDNNFAKIKEEAERTTRHGKLMRIEPHILDKSVVIKFCYTTGDAMGLNMINIATETACKFIVSTVKPEEFFLRSNFSSVKKISMHNYTVGGFGKMVIADIVIPQKLLKRLFQISPEAMTRYCHLTFVSSAHAGMVGMNGHTANGLAAIFIACGQDVANVVDSQASVSACETTKNGDLYVSIKIPNLVIGTVGGGVGLGAQRECLEMLSCYGTGKAKKFAEIVAASLLAGEIAVAAAIVGGYFVDAHKKYGRKPNEILQGRFS